MWTSVLCFSALLLLAVVQACQPIVKPPKVGDNDNPELDLNATIEALDTKIMAGEENVKKLTDDLNLKYDVVRDLKWNYLLPSEEAKLKEVEKELQALEDKALGEIHKLAEQKVDKRVLVYGELTKEQWNAKIAEVKEKLGSTNATLREGKASIAEIKAEIEGIKSTTEYKTALKQYEEDQQFNKRVELTRRYLKLKEELQVITNQTLKAEKTKEFEEIAVAVPGVDKVTNEENQEELKKQLLDPIEIVQVRRLEDNLEAAVNGVRIASYSISVLEYEKKALEKKIVS